MSSTRIQPLPTLLLLFICQLVWTTSSTAADCSIIGECPAKLVKVSSNPLAEPYTCSNNPMEATVLMLEDGEQEIELTENDEAIFLVGRAGHGISTLTSFLATNGSLLISYEAALDQYLIRDCNEKLDPSFYGLLPDLMLESVTNTAFYELPPFQDSRDEDKCSQITAAHFVHRVARRVKKFKFIMVINHSALLPGVSRMEFVALLKSVMDLVPNIEKFGPALSLICTKVNYPSSDDDILVTNIKRFMMEDILPYLSQVFDGDQLRKAVYIVSSLIDPSLPNKIGLFRMPNDCGLVSEIELMQQNKRNLMSVVIENLQFIDTIEGDLSPQLSFDARLLLSQIEMENEPKISELLISFGLEFKNFVTPLFDCPDCSEQLATIVNLLFSNPDFSNGYEDESVWLNLNFTQIVQRITNPQFVPPGLIIGTNVTELEIYSKNLTPCQYLECQFDVIQWLQPMKDFKNYLMDHLPHKS